MKTLAAIISLVIAARVGAQTPADTAISARSASGQFLVAGVVPGAVRSVVAVGTNANLIRLQPSLTAISCERIKQSVWRELEFEGRWNHPVHIALRPALTPDDNVFIVIERSRKGWSYRVRLPDVLPRERYLRAIVQVVLSDLANRRAGKKPVDIPVWLTEGLAFHLLCNREPELLLGTPRYHANGILLDPTYVEYRRWSELEKAHKILVGTSPLTFEELSWPSRRQLEGPDDQMFCASAQLFFCKLLNLPSGSKCMRNFISALPDFLNWQMAFLDGFKPHFKRPLDIEKWWALESTGFAGRDLTRTWPYEESWAKLVAALVEPVDVFVSTNELPHRSVIPFQNIIREWPLARQKSVLRRKTTELSALCLRIAPELMQLSKDYGEAIGTYLRDIEAQKPPLPHPHITTYDLRSAQIRLLSRLAALDMELKRLQPGGDQQNTSVNNQPTVLDVNRDIRLPETRLRAN